MIDVRQANSSLVLYDILVNSVEFKMSEGYKNLKDENLKFGFVSDIYESEDGSIYKITTTTTISNEGNKDLDIKLVMSGYFGLKNEDSINEERKDHLIERNTLTIMFPYIRSYITNLTAQSGGKPIIIPPININALLKEDPEYKEVK